MKEVSEAIKQWIEDQRPKAAGLMQDLLSGAISQINVNEIAKNLIEANYDESEDDESEDDNDQEEEE